MRQRFTARFQHKLWQVVSSCRTGAVCWSPSGDSILFRLSQFKKEYLDRKGAFCKSNKIPSFIRQLNLYGFHKVMKSRNTGKKRSKDFHEFQNIHFQKGRRDLLEFVIRQSSTSNVKTHDGGRRNKRGRKPQYHLKVNLRSSRAPEARRFSAKDLPVQPSENLDRTPGSDSVLPTVIMAPNATSSFKQAQAKLGTISSILAKEQSEVNPRSLPNAKIGLPHLLYQLKLNKTQNPVNPSTLAVEKDQSSSSSGYRLSEKLQNICRHFPFDAPNGLFPPRVQKTLRGKDAAVSKLASPANLGLGHPVTSAGEKDKPASSRSRRFKKKRFSNIDDDFPHDKYTKNFLDEYIQSDKEESDNGCCSLAALFKPGTKPDDEEKEYKRANYFFNKKWSEIAVELSGEEKEIEELKFARERSGPCFICNPNVPPSWILRHS